MAREADTLREAITLSQRGELNLRLRRLLTFAFRAGTHIYAILLGVAGSAILALPAWVRPLLSPEHQKLLDRYDLLSVSTYSLLSILVLITGLILASFLAWEEQALESERLQKEVSRLEALRKKPDILARVLQYSGRKADDPFDTMILVDLNNQGGEGRVDGWWLGIDPPDAAGWTIAPLQHMLMDDPATSDVPHGRAVPAAAHPTSIKVPAHDIVQARVHFATNITWAEATASGTKWRLGFHDNTGREYVISVQWTMRGFEEASTET